MSNNSIFPVKVKSCNRVLDIFKWLISKVLNKERSSKGKSHLLNNWYSFLFTSNDCEMHVSVSLNFESYSKICCVLLNL